MRASVQASEVIKAPVSRVFEYISDLDRHMLWISGMTYCSEHGPLSVGMIYESRNSALGREISSQARVVRVVPGRLVEIESVAAVIEATVKYELGQRDEDTVVTCALVVKSWHPVLSLAIPLLESLAQTRIDGDLRNLKTLCEAESQKLDTV